MRNRASLLIEHEGDSHFAADRIHVNKAISLELTSVRSMDYPEYRIGRFQFNEKRWTNMPICRQSVARHTVEDIFPLIQPNSNWMAFDAAYTHHQGSDKPER